MTLIELTNDTIRVVINPAQGCMIQSLELKDPDGKWTAVLRTPEAGGGSFVMVPWTNRIKDARFEFQSQQHTLESNHPDGSAIHGVGRDLEWKLADRSPYSSRFVLDSRLIENANFPFEFGVVMRVEIHDMSVEIDLDLTNLGDSPMPGGVGHHPYFMRALWDGGDELNVMAGVGGRYPCVDQIPAGAMVDDQVCADLRGGGGIGNPGLDDVFGGFDGHAVLEWDKSGVRCAIECSEAFGHLVVFTPRDSDDGAPLPWVCVEPVTMVNDGFNRCEEHTDTGVRILGPGQTLHTRLKFSFERV